MAAKCVKCFGNISIRMVQIAILCYSKRCTENDVLLHTIGNAAKLALNSYSATYWLGSFEQITKPLWTSVCHLQNGLNDTTFGGLFSSVQFSRSVMSDSLWPHEPQHARHPCPSPTPEVHPNPCPLCRWCHRTILSSVVPFSSCPQSFPASGSFQMSQLSASGGQSIGVSASTSAPPMNTQDWSPLGWTGWISLQSKGLSRVFSNTMIQKNQFFCAQFSL